MLRQIEMILLPWQQLPQAIIFTPCVTTYFLYIYTTIDMVTEHFKLQIHFISFIKKGQLKIKYTKRSLSELAFLHKKAQIKKILKE